MGQPLSQVLFCATFLFAYTVQAIAGFAGNVFVMPVGVHLFGMGFSASVLNALGFFSCGMLALMNIRSVDWRVRAHHWSDGRVAVRGLVAELRHSAAGAHEDFWRGGRGHRA